MQRTAKVVQADFQEFYDSEIRGDGENADSEDARGDDRVCH